MIFLPGSLFAEGVYLYGSLENSSKITLFIQDNRGDLSGWFLLAGERFIRPLTGRALDESHWIMEEPFGVSEGGMLFNGYWQENLFTGESITMEGESAFTLEKAMELSELSYGRSNQINFRSQIPLFYGAGLEEWNLKLRENEISAMEQFLSLYEESEDSYSSWNSQKTINLSYMDDRWISFLSETYEFTDGGNGIQILESILLFQSGDSWEKLELSDLLASQEDLKELGDWVRNKLEAVGAPWTDKLEWIDRGWNSYLQDFTLTPAGITFFFESYLVGPYAYGVTEVFVPWNETAHLWNERALSIAVTEVKSEF